jgi:predicted outer membrane repeat protein
VLPGLTITISKCVFEDNEAGSGGGALSFVDSAATISDCFFAGNSVTSVSSVGGGGAVISTSNCLLDFTDCAFVGNFAGDRGELM